MASAAAPFELFFLGLSGGRRRGKTRPLRGGNHGDGFRSTREAPRECEEIIGGAQTRKRDKEKAVVETIGSREAEFWFCHGTGGTTAK
ncbi:hypothetical protein E2562_037855 [Oryza meyeriana var. granulata]|uniref:Uncharacterized protein n=1 Tax=Oryza meyeriana var. granulata TaxID=110450 RepID=A0A6G1E884_9ORYZ|nr:hypothetical protein E2562_037855 [Oryza meyeriana var. granulata]